MIIEVDAYKNKIDGYDPKRSEKFHSESAKLADKDFTKELKTKKYKRIIFMAGGTASGKTEFAYSYLDKKENLVYDGTFSNGFKAKTDRIKRYCKNNPSVKIILILPVDWTRSFETFLKRERQMNTFTFFKTHTNSKMQVADILEKTKYRVEIYVSFILMNSNKLEFKRIKINKRFKLATELRNMSKEMQEIVDMGELEKK